VPNIPGPVGAPGPTGGPPPNPSPSADDVANLLSVEEAWHKLNYGIGRTQPDLVRDGQLILNAIDKKIGSKSR
jgi:hypothetical protein